MVIADGALPPDCDAQRSQLPAEVLGIGVKNVAEQQLVPTLMISAVMDKSTLKFYLIGDAHPDALGLLCGLGSSAARPGMAASAARISSSSGRIFGCGGVKMVQQSS